MPRLAEGDELPPFTPAKGLLRSLLQALRDPLKNGPVTPLGTTGLETGKDERVEGGEPALISQTDSSVPLQLGKEMGGEKTLKDFTER